MVSHRKRVKLRSEPSYPPSLQGRRGDIDGLRAIAILMVVSMHVGLVNVHGGVDVSFVLSGFLNTFILFKEIDRTGRIKIADFLGRRFRRLALGAAIVTGLTLVFVWRYMPLQFKSISTDASYAAVSLLNWRLVGEGTDYFAADGTQTPFQHYWSLCIEEQFYLLLPFALMFLAWAGRKLFRSNRFVTVAVMAAVVGWSFYECVRLTAINQPLAYFGSYTRVWELAAGSLLALGATQVARMNKLFAAVLSWTGLAAIVATGLLITDETPLPGYAVLGPVIGTIMVIAGGCAAPKYGPTKLLSHWTLKIIADNSYTAYLVHWPVLLLWEPIAGYQVTTISDKLRVIAVTAIISPLIYYPCMKRYQNAERHKDGPRFSLRIGVVLTASVAALSGCAANFAPLNIPTATAATGSAQQAKVLPLPGNLQPSLVKASKDLADHGCIDGLDETAFLPRASCILGTKKAARTVVVFGDSHAWQWGSLFHKIGLDLNVRVVTVTKEGCPAGAYTFKNEELKRTYTECTKWRTSALRYINSVHPDVVVVSSRIREVATKKGMESTLGSLKATGAELVYMTDVPRPKSNVPNCLVSHAKNINDCASSAGKAVEFRGDRAMERGVAVKYGARIVDVVPQFCTKGTCPVVIDGKVVYFDSSHVTATFSRTLVPWLEPKIKAALK